jgi:hypothetical protein
VNRQYEEGFRLPHAGRGEAVHGQAKGRHKAVDIRRLNPLLQFSDQLAGRAVSTH